MMHTPLRTVACLSMMALLVSCTKKDEIIEAITGSKPACGADGARVEAFINDAEWCADGTVQAISNDGTVIVTGLNLNTSTLVFNIDQLAVDTFAVQGEANSVLYMEGGVTYLVAEGTVGALHINAYDPASGKVKGDLDVVLTRNTLSGTRRVRANFEVRVPGQPG